MSFNNFTYDGNEYADLAWKALEIARGFQAEGLPHLAGKAAKLARAYMHISTLNRQRQMQKEHG
jgi:hypothetical protein